MITAMGDVMREAFRRNWITTRDGNISLKRRDTEKLYITPSGVRKTTIIPETIIRMTIFEGKLLLNDKSSPSGELDMHWLLQKTHNKTRCVVHLHPTYTIAAMMAGYDLQDLASQFPEVHRYTRVASNVGVHPACSSRLAIDTQCRLKLDEKGNNYYDIVGQDRHGVCAIGTNPWEAFEHIERLEHICKIALASGGLA
jgi:ribulose-5-phosphate 4-epimerase/fuculose-1-phosphate aldolase